MKPLHHKKHTLAKRFLSLLCVLALCLGLLPVTALAVDAPATLYVGNQQVISGTETTYWSTNNSGKLTQSAENNAWNVKYDPNTVTLTLKNATIEGVLNNVNTAGTGIYAASSSGTVSLNIVLEGENRVSGGHGINVSSDGGYASLNISGPGSLTVSATATNGIGILVQAQSDANLTIDGANVNAVVTETNGRGVELSTGQAGKPNLTIEVKGGSLQASGQPNGIKFFTSENNTCANANLKVSGNAMVKTSGITTEADGSGSQGAVLTTEAGSGGTGGIVFDGSDGTVYGDVTLKEDLTIGEGESLKLDDGASLSAGDHNVIVDGGTLTGDVTGAVIYKVTDVSLDKSTLSLIEGENEQLIATVEPSNATNKTVTWSSSAESVATVDNSGKVTAVGAGTAQITVTTEDGNKTATCTVTVKEPPYTGKYSYEVSTSVGDHGSLTVDRYATEGEKVTITVTPDEAYKLDDLVVTAGGKEVALTAGGDGTYSFTMPSADVKISATFAEDPDWTEPEEPATDVSDIFLDIAPNAWYKDAVQYAYAGGLMTGVSANEFAPEATTTRAMIVSMLARLEGVESAESAGFADVAANDWYATAVNWAAASGITSGTGDGNFSPNTAITREQLAAILMNYAQYKGQDTSARATLDTYSDATAISSWANDVMSWAVAEGLLTGVTNDQLQPQGNATRAQVAAILQRFLAE